MLAEEFEFNGMYCKKWLSENETAVIQIIHGLGEMTEYYEQLAAFMTERGVSVYMAEMRCHGRTKLPSDADDIIGVMADESLGLSEYIKSRHTAPLILLGHSMGEMIAQQMMKKFCFDKVILTGCVHIDNVNGLLAALDAEIAQKGIDAPCVEVFMKIFGRVAERFPEKCTVSWVTSDLERAMYYEQLPYTNVMYSNRFYKSFLTAAKEVQDSGYPYRLPYKIPLFIACGTEDSVGMYGDYAPALVKNFLEAGFDVRLKLYDGMRHSILQEKERETVYADIYEFINKQI